MLGRRPARAVAAAIERTEGSPRIKPPGAVYYCSVDAESDAALSRRARAGDGVPDGYRAMNEREAIKVMIEF